MISEHISNTIYSRILRPLFFSIDPETVHDFMTKTGSLLGDYSITRMLIENTLAFKSANLSIMLNGIKFPNPIGLAAGFNYDGHMASIINNVGFGFQTVGTVTAKPYEGNKKPRLKRLIRSRSLLVNKGFKSLGAKKVKEILDAKNLEHTVMGVSIGSSNVPEVNTLPLAIEDISSAFETFKNCKYVKFFELNISCPNIELSDNFINTNNLDQLLRELQNLDIKQPVYIKMPNEVSISHTNEISDVALKHNIIKGFIFSNLVKDRSNPKFVKEEIEAVKNLRGNFSGKPTEENSLKLIKNARERYGKDVTLIGTGGVFAPEDVIKKLEAGADLVQLITGMIFQGPQLIGQINKYLSENYMK